MTDRILTREQFFECLDAIRSVPPNIDNTHPLYERGDGYRKRAERHDAALRAEVERLEKRDAAFKQFLKDTSDDMECLPGCDSFAHERECPVCFPDVAFRHLREKVERLEGALLAANNRVERLEKIIKKACDSQEKWWFEAHPDPEPNETPERSAKACRAAIPWVREGRAALEKGDG